MRMVRWAVIASVAVVGCGTIYAYRDVIGEKLGMSAPANAAAGVSPAGAAQPPGRRGRMSPGGPVPVVLTTVTPKSLIVTMFS